MSDEQQFLSMLRRGTPPEVVRLAELVETGQLESNLAEIIDRIHAIGCDLDDDCTCREER